VSENGYLRWYVASMSIGAVVVLALLMVLRCLIVKFLFDSFRQKSALR
jgi:hypothetical protein